LVAGVRGITLEQRPVNPVRFFGGLGGRLAVPEVTVSYNQVLQDDGEVALLGGIGGITL
jgi:hypothetical protein